MDLGCMDAGMHCKPTGSERSEVAVSGGLNCKERYDTS